MPTMGLSGPGSPNRIPFPAMELMGIRSVPWGGQGLSGLALDLHQVLAVFDRMSDKGIDDVGGLEDGHRLVSMKTLFAQHPPGVVVVQRGDLILIGGP